MNYTDMIINKVLNNNVVTIINESDEEAVVMGRGLAFQKKKGDEIDEDKIEKIFVLENKSINEKLITLVNDIPAKYLEIAEDIIKYAENKLNKKLNENIYLTLTDHISFAISRAEKNLEIKNAMLWDIKYYRFVTHLKFFTQRLSSGRYYEDNDNDLFDMIKLKYPKSYECTKRIEGFVKQKYNTQLTKEEMLYLIIHTARVVHENC